MNHGGCSFLLTTLMAAAVILPASAFTLEPMSTSLAPSGAGAIGTFRLKNDNVERIAIRIAVLERSMTPEGKDQTQAADKLFTIYPSRLVLEPSSSATFKIQWKGATSPDRELCFRLVAEQVPVDFGTTRASGIRIMFRYVASLYVTPVSSTWKLLAESALGAIDGDGNRGFLVEVLNSGGRHVIAVDSSFELREAGSDADPILLSGEAIGSADGANYLPGLPRRFFLPHPDAVPGRIYDARLGFTPEK